MDITVTRLYRDKNFYNRNSLPGYIYGYVAAGSHNALSGLQGGSATLSEFYHLTATEYGALGVKVVPFGTPSDNQVAVWTSASAIEGTANLTFDGTQ
jgi:hypothetical protein